MMSIWKEHKGCVKEKGWDGFDWLILELFIDAVLTALSYSTDQDGKVVMNGGWVRIWNEIVMVCLKVLPQHSSVIIK
jgi:hypothetical protein